MQQLTHYGIHFLVPLLVAICFYRNALWKAYFIMLGALLIDLDHLLASPIFDPQRCSINFHPLHSYFAIVVYALLLIPKKTRIFGIGLLIHIVADSVDCLFM